VTVAVRTGPTRVLRAVALLESLSFAVLLVGSVLKRTTETDLVPVLGPVHGALFLALGVLVLGERRAMGWSWRFTLVMLTLGSPGAHFAVAATARRQPPR
jgi:integral membrane protein